MSTHTPRKPGLRPALPLLAGCAVLASLAGCREDVRKPIEPPADLYPKMVSAFYTGTLAMNVNDRDRALTRLTEATQLVPKEPAPWGNLALLALRGQDTQRAEEWLEKAQELAPPDSRLELLAGVLAERKSLPEQALEHYRKAVELDPKNLRARYAYAEALNRSGTPQNEAKAREQLALLVEAAPDNMAALIELGRAEARAGSKEPVERVVSRLVELIGSGTPEIQEQLKLLKAALAAGDMKALATRMAVFGNVLQPAPLFKQSSTAIGKGDTAAGIPIERFIRLPNPNPNPAPPDTSLNFSPQTLATDSSEWAAALPLRPAPAAELTATQAPDPPLVPVFANSGGFTIYGETRQTLSAGGGVPQPRNVLVADWNNDYRLDVALATPGGLRLYEQSSAGTWTDVTARSKAPAGSGYTGIWALDLDQEGDLDLILGTATGASALRNNLDGTFTEIQPFPGVKNPHDFAWSDVDGDGDADVAFLDGDGEVSILENLRGAHFRAWSNPGELGKGKALSSADPDRDGILDFIVLSEDGAVKRVGLDPMGSAWRGEEIARWEPAGGGEPERLLWADLDNNGAMDLVIAGTGGSRVYLGDEHGKLSSLATSLDARIYSVGDVNEDGRVDMVGIDKKQVPVRLQNAGDKSYHWAVVRPRADLGVKDNQGNQKLNSFGVGGEAEIRSALLYQKQPIGGPILHFGLGENESADFVRIVWPNGQSQGEFELKADHRLVTKQRLTSSCPWLFAWNGKAVEFVTDILWKSPLGLRINAQDTAGVSQTLDWVKVRGDQLQPRDGYYDLRVTSELWETNFFDHVSLMAVDHPEGTEVLIDERFSIPQPPLELIATGPVLPLARATDDVGQDATALVRDRDGRHVDSFGLGRFQGITRDHWLEVELPADAAKMRHPVLVGYGWVFPTDSSINVAISQGNHAPPRGLSIEVPDGRGWREARSGLGFPAGKNKTVVLDLHGLLPKGSAASLRLRLRTNLEIYWDSLGVADRRSDVTLEERKIAPASAELRYRGFSTTSQPSRSSPELPDYNRLAGAGQRWLDLTGLYTRFGDVMELVEKVDDRYVIKNAGDEILLRFRALPAPRAGWVRDFVFISDGWDKDGNFNTGHGQTVGPLPSHDDPDYNRPLTRLEDDPVYQKHPQDWVKYHTRFISPERFRNAVRP